MVGAVHYVGTEADEQLLLAYLGGPDAIRLRPWPVVDVAAPPLLRTDLPSALVVVSDALGGPTLVGLPGAVPDPDPLPAVGILARHRRTPPVPPPAGVTTGLVNTNRSPVLFWERRLHEHGLVVGSLGSQADAPVSIGADYVWWVNRVSSWVRRRGTPVWGLVKTRVRPDLDIDLGFVNTVHALPGALALLESGTPLRG